MQQHNARSALHMTRKIIFRVLLCLCMLSVVNLGIYPAYADEMMMANTPSAVTDALFEPVAVQEEKSSAVLQADDFAYDPELNIFTASGNVVLEQDGQLVTSDVMIYDQKQDLVIAQGNVVFTDKAKQTYYADKVRLEQGFKTGVVEQLGLMFPDGSRLAGRIGVKESETRLVLRDGLYSPCNLCVSNPQKAPQWRLNASKVIHDKEAQDVYYHNVTLDAYGVPVMYMPYFSHPDPDVVARSGLLMPGFSNDSKKGMMLRNYYYYNISPYEDATFEVSPSTKGGTVFGTDYRRNFEKGTLSFKGSLNRSEIRGGHDDKDIIKPEKWRGHIYSSGSYGFAPDWVAGFNFNRTTDDYYLRDYDFDHYDVLTSQLYMQHMKERDLFDIRAMYFQDLRPNITQEQSDVLPWAKYRLYGDPNDMLGGRWNVNNEMVSLFRNGQNSVSRISTIPSWERRDILPFGLQSSVNTQFRADGYWVRQHSPFDTNATPPDGNIDKLESRFIPSVTSALSYPLIRPADTITALIEPKVSLTVAPNRTYNDIPNEDSRDAQIDMLNLYSDNRFPGSDRYENGSHMAYGFKFGGYHNATGNAAFITLGQSYRLSSDNPFPEGSGLENDSSDYVGQIEATFADKFYMDYRFQLSEENLSSRRHELQAAYMTDGFEARTNYVFAQQVFGTGLAQDRQQIGISAAKEVFQNWAVAADTLHDLTGDAGMLKAGFGVQYKNECLRLSLRAERNLTDRLTGGSDTRFLFSLGLRNLGGYDTPLLDDDALYSPFGRSNRI